MPQGRCPAARIRRIGDISLVDTISKYIQLRVHKSLTDYNRTERQQQACMLRQLLYFALGPLFKNFHIDSVRTQKPPNVNMFRLAVATETADSLRFTGIVNLLRRGEEWGQEDCVIGDSQVSTACALVHNVEKEDAGVIPILIRLKSLGSRRRRPLDLKIVDLVRLQSGPNLLHQVWELDKDQDPFFGWDLLPVDRQHEILSE